MGVLLIAVGLPVRVQHAAAAWSRSRLISGAQSAGRFRWAVRLGCVRSNNGDRSPPSLWIPALYVVIALPVLIAGRSLSSVLLVYVDQANTFHSLSRNAGSLWALIRYVPYLAGTIIGLAVTGAERGLRSWSRSERSVRTDAAFMLLAGCVSLLMTPYLMPKMHERYFYAFEITSIILAQPAAVRAHRRGGADRRGVHLSGVRIRAPL